MWQRVIRNIFRRNFPLPSSGQHVPPKLWETSVRVPDIAFQKAVIYTLTAVRTIDLDICLSIVYASFTTGLNPQYHPRRSGLWPEARAFTDMPAVKCWANISTQFSNSSLVDIKHICSVEGLANQYLCPRYITLGSFAINLFVIHPSKTLIWLTNMTYEYVLKVRQKKKK